MEQPEGLEGLKMALLGYREAIRGFIPVASEVFEEELGSLMNQCTQAVSIIDRGDREALPRLKAILENVVKRVNEIYEEVNEGSEGYDLTFLGYFLYYSSGYGPSHVP